MRVSGAMTIRLGRSRSPMRTGVKRGWTDMTVLLGKGSSGDDDFAGLFARLDEARASAIRSGGWDLWPKYISELFLRRKDKPGTRSTIRPRAPERYVLRRVLCPL